MLWYGGVELNYKLAVVRVISKELQASLLSRSTNISYNYNNMVILIMLFTQG